MVEMAVKKCSGWRFGAGGQPEDYSRAWWKYPSRKQSWFRLNVYRNDSERHVGIPTREGKLGNPTLKNADDVVPTGHTPVDRPCDHRFNPLKRREIERI